MDREHEPNGEDASVRSRPRGVVALVAFVRFGVAAATFAAVTLAFPGTTHDRVWAINPRGLLAAVGSSSP